jgi:hypothetical protein
MGDRRYAYRSVVGKHERKRLRGRPRLGWKDTVKINLKEMAWNGLDSSGSGG